MVVSANVRFSHTVNTTTTTNTNKNINYDKVFNYKNFPRENIYVLNAKMAWLVGRKKAFEKINAEMPTIVVKDWIKAMEEKESEINALLTRCVEEVEFASEVESQLKAVEELGKQATKLEEDLEKKGRSVYDLLATTNSTTTQGHPMRRLIGLECHLQKTLECIARTNFTVIGILGACGIGKTTLLKEIERTIRCNEGNQAFPFTKVILVNVTKTISIEKIQNKIAEQLGLVNEGEPSFYKLDFNKRPIHLSEALAKEPFIIMLDDVWDEVKLDQIGIPCRQETPMSKIVYATRSKTTCASMDTDAIVVMEPLSWSHSLKLFKLHSADIDDEDIVYKFLNKCNGLPLAIIEIAKGIVARDPRYIYDCLNDSPTEINRMEEKVLGALKPSFEALKDVTKSCLMFCVLFQDSKDINRNTLIDYWIGEELVDIGGNAGFRSIGNDIVEQLLGYWLLEKGSDNMHVKMHNIVRCMAIWLASGDADKETLDQTHQFQFYAGKEFDIEKMEGVKRASFVDTVTDLKLVLKNFPLCEKLVTLLMHLCQSHWKSNLKQPKPKSISQSFNYFFDKYRIPECRVLDMAHQPILYIPSKLFHLKHLQYLNLSYTLIEKLPTGLGKLKKLKQLDLTGTKNLNHIPSNVISSLLSLKSLKLFDSNYDKFDRKGQLSLKELELLSLDELQLPLRNLNTLKCLSDSTRICMLTTYLKLKFDSFDITMLEILKKFKKLEVLSLIRCASEDKEIKIDIDSIPNLKTLLLRDNDKISNIAIISHGLCKLHISLCSELKSIMWLCYLQNLEILEVEACEKIVNLLSFPSEAVTNGEIDDVDANNCQSLGVKLQFYDENDTINMREGRDVNTCLHQDHTHSFKKLKSLRLVQLPKLKTISYFNLMFECLEVVSISNCSKLKKIQVNSTNKSRRIQLSCEKTWWDALEWEDDIINPSSFLVPLWCD